MGENIPAHEFHYASLDGLPSEQKYAYKVMRGHGIDGEHDGLILHNLTACFAHQRNLTANRWAESFVAFVASQKAIKFPQPEAKAALTA